MSAKLFTWLSARQQLSYKAHLQLGYAKNSEGFRSDPFAPRKDLNVASIGCSNVLGWGLEDKETFPNLFCEHISKLQARTVNNWNLGLAAKSNDYIARTVLASEKLLNPDVYLIVFTGMGRREYWDAAGNCVDYVPSNCTDNIEWLRKHRPEDLHLQLKLHELTSPCENTANFIKNFYTVAYALRDKPWFFSFSCGDEQGTVQGIDTLIDQSKYVGYFEAIDVAKDGKHPGPKSNEKIANLFLKSYLDEPVSKTHVEGPDEVEGDGKPLAFFFN